MEHHKQPTLQEPSLLRSGVPATQNMDQESTGVNIAAGQRIREPDSWYHLARALLLSNAKCKHCVSISYLRQNTVPNWCF